MSLTAINEDQAQLILKDKKGKEYQFLINKFNVEDALEIALAVHRDVLSLLPANIHDVIHFENLNVLAFKDTMKKVFTETYLQPKAIRCSDLNAVKLPLDLLMPLFMEVIKYNDFFILLGIESTIETMLLFLKVSIDKFEMQMLNETSMMQDQITEFNQVMDQIEKEQKEQEEVQMDSQSLTT